MMVQTQARPRGSKYLRIKVSGSKHHTFDSYSGPKTSNIGYLDSLGGIFFCVSSFEVHSCETWLFGTPPRSSLRYASEAQIKHRVLSGSTLTFGHNEGTLAKGSWSCRDRVSCR